jgi:predicted glutamine amidotransferase
MCRLLAWVSKEPVSVEQLLGEQGLSEFIRLAGVHRDGWGMAWSSDPGKGESVGADRTEEWRAPQMVHSTVSAAADPQFSQLCRQVTSNVGMAHLRRATPGMKVDLLNAHPFHWEDMVMAHNGGIFPLSTVRDILPAAMEATVRGTTDSERYLRAVLSARQANGGSTVDALGEVIVRLFADRSPSSLNAVCLTADSLLFASAYNPHVPEEAIGEPADSYYATYYRELRGGVVVASSGIDQSASAGWHRLENMTVMVIDRFSGEYTIRPLALPPPESFWGVAIGSVS